MDLSAGYPRPVDRARRLGAVLLLAGPGALVILLSFNGGGFFAGVTGLAAALVLIASSLRVTLAGEPLAGAGPALAAATALLGCSRSGRWPPRLVGLVLACAAGVRPGAPLPRPARSPRIAPAHPRQDALDGPGHRRRHRRRLRRRADHPRPARGVADPAEHPGRPAQLSAHLLERAGPPRRPWRRPLPGADLRRARARGSRGCSAQGRCRCSARRSS